MRYVWIISAIAGLSLAISTASAQQVDQTTRQQLEQLRASFSERWNKQDAAGIAKLYTQDAVLMTGRAPYVKTGTQIEQNYTDNFKRGIIHNEAKIIQFIPLGADSVMTIGEYHLTGQGQTGPIKIDGHYSAVNVREGGAWKIQQLSAVGDLPE
jgi:uncharacterized protein (TIGR02246 family)